MQALKGIASHIFPC